MDQTLNAFFLFAFASSVTPGPNNIMLMASGANFGLLRTLPHLLGISFGFTLMLVLVAAGLTQIFEVFPRSYQALQVVGSIYLLVLAYKIMTSAKPIGVGGKRATPMTFLQAALFQWVNPKAWTMALTAITVYAPSQNVESFSWITILFVIINLPSIGVWAVLGLKLRKILRDPMKLRVFNWTMGLLLIASVYPMLF